MDDNDLFTWVEEETNNHSSSDSPNKPKKKFPLWGKILIGVLCFLCVIVVAGAIFVNDKLNKINRSDNIVIETVAVEQEDFEVDEIENLDNLDVIAPEDVTWNAVEEVSGEDEIINILLIGQDRRKSQGRCRSDTMIIATINKTDKTLTLTSLMRDLYVQIPGYSDNRLNAAYAFGGMPLLDSTIKTNFDVTIDGNIEVDFFGFCDVINALGGIDIYVAENEINTLNAYVKDACRQYGIAPDSYYLTSGGNLHLNGIQALSYARIRYVGNGDYGRTERQRKVIAAAFDKVMTMSLPEMLTLADTVLPLITTDMTNMELVSLATDVFTMDISELENHNIPQDASYYSANIRGMSVLVPDIDSCRKKLKEIIYE